jgi:hypothetical protein
MRGLARVVRERPNLHFFSPYEQAAKALAGELAGQART